MHVREESMIGWGCAWTEYANTQSRQRELNIKEELRLSRLDPETEEEKEVRYARQAEKAAERQTAQTDYGRVLELERELRIGQFSRFLAGCTPEDITMGGV